MVERAQTYSREKENKIKKTTLSFNRTKVGVQDDEPSENVKATIHFFSFCIRKKFFLQMTSPHRQQQIPELETVAFHMSISPGTTPIDWKSRYETLQFQYELELERMRLHYEHKYQERVTGT